MTDDQECTCSIVRRASRTLTNAYDRHLTTSGLKMSQFSILKKMVVLGPLGIQALARALGIDRTTLGRTIRPLQRDGFVQVSVNDADRRGRKLQLTAAGRDKVAMAEPLWRAAQARLEHCFGTDKTEELQDLLRALMGLDLLERGDVPSC